jgi:hypothetical protein
MQIQTISSRIHEIRGIKVILDYDLAILYDVETRALKQAVKRNLERFPNDFMFILTENEFVKMVSQNVIPSKSHLGGSKPFAFTEQGVAMMSGVLKSKKAIQIHIEIMRAFVLMSQYALSHQELTEKLKEIEIKFNHQFNDVYEAINFLIQQEHQSSKQRNRKQIGY